MACVHRSISRALPKLVAVGQTSASVGRGCAVCPDISTTSPSSSVRRWRRWSPGTLRLICSRHNRSDMRALRWTGASSCVVDAEIVAVTQTTPGVPTTSPEHVEAGDKVAIAPSKNKEVFFCARVSQLCHHHTRFTSSFIPNTPHTCLQTVGL